MSNSLGRLWSDSPNAPQIPFWLYHLEKDYFAGMLVGAVAYGVLNLTPIISTSVLTRFVRPIFAGIVMALFCQCIIVLLGHINPIKGGMKWALLTHTLVMFVFLTLPVGITLSGYGISYIEGRRFLGYGEYPPGPLGYGDILNTKAVITVFSIMFPLNQWLADGLLVGPVSNPVAAGVSDVAPLVASLLCHLFNEMVGHSLSVSDVPCLYRYVLKSSMRWRRYGH